MSEAIDCWALGGAVLSRHDGGLRVVDGGAVIVAPGGAQHSPETGSRAAPVKARGTRWKVGRGRAPEDRLDLADLARRGRNRGRIVGERVMLVAGEVSGRS